MPPNHIKRRPKSGKYALKLILYITHAISLNTQEKRNIDLGFPARSVMYPAIGPASIAPTSYAHTTRARKNLVCSRDLI